MVKSLISYYFNNTLYYISFFYRKDYLIKLYIRRYMLLKAYYYLVRSQKKTALKIIKQTKKLSTKMNNKMIYTWANHCEEV